MVRAIGLAGGRVLAAEVEIILARMADRPHAGRAGEIEHVAPWRRFLRDNPRRQSDAVDLADDRVLRDADTPADLGGRDPLFPQPGQRLDALRRPSLDDLRRLGLGRFAFKRLEFRRFTFRWLDLRCLQFRQLGFRDRFQQRPCPVHSSPRILWPPPQSPQNTVALLRLLANPYPYVASY